VVCGIWSASARRKAALRTGGGGPPRPADRLRPVQRVLALSVLAAAAFAGCGPLGGVDTEGIEHDVRMRLMAQGASADPLSGAQSSGSPAVSVSCPDEVKSEEGTRFRCSASVTRIGSPGAPATPGAAPGTTAPSAQTQDFVVEGTVTSGAGDARWTLRTAD
jgi:hypothetical protein